MQIIGSDGKSLPVGGLPSPSTTKRAIFIRRLERHLLPIGPMEAGGLGVEGVVLFDKNGQTPVMEEIFTLLDMFAGHSQTRVHCAVAPPDQVQLQALAKVFEWCAPTVTVTIDNNEAIITTPVKQTRHISAPANKAPIAGRSDYKIRRGRGG